MKALSIFTVTENHFDFFANSRQEFWVSANFWILTSKFIRILSLVWSLELKIG